MYWTKDLWKIGGEELLRTQVHIFSLYAYLVYLFLQTCCGTSYYFSSYHYYCNVYKTNVLLRDTLITHYSSYTFVRILMRSVLDYECMRIRARLPAWSNVLLFLKSVIGFKRAIELCYSFRLSYSAYCFTHRIIDIFDFGRIDSVLELGPFSQELWMCRTELNPWLSVNTWLHVVQV